MSSGNLAQVGPLFERLLVIRLDASTAPVLMCSPAKTVEKLSGTAGRILDDTVFL